MVNKKEKKIMTRIPDSRVWDSFLNHINETYGQTYGYIGNEVQNALKYYIENSQKGSIIEIDKKYLEKIQKLELKNVNMQNDNEKNLQECEMEVLRLKSLVEEMDSVKKVNDEYIQEFKIFETKLSFFENLQDKYDTKMSQYEDLLNKHDKLRNNYDHLQARFNKSQSEVNQLEREISGLRVAVAKVQKLSLFERLLNRLPAEVKELNSGEDID